ncbi:MAG: OmpA family protein [Deltaproteobacteria bacterium]|nr:OmpA family protein [Deltaproteobacteria bacterium]
MIKRRKQEEHENTDRWMVSYADFITLLFAFFIAMYALSTINEGKYKVVSESIAIAFDPSKSRTKDIAAIPELNEYTAKDIVTEMFKRTFSSDYKKIQSAVSELERDNKVFLSMERRGIVISLSEKVIFESGRADILQEAKSVIDEIAMLLKEMPNYIRIEGHTDNIPISTSQFPSNWELSSSRALNILRYMVDLHRLNPGKLSAIGYGEFRPVASNDTSEGRLKNRRVDIVILNKEGTVQEPW